MIDWQYDYKNNKWIYEMLKFSNINVVVYPPYLNHLILKWN